MADDDIVLIGAQDGDLVILETPGVDVVLEAPSPGVDTILSFVIQQAETPERTDSEPVTVAVAAAGSSIASVSLARSYRLLAMTVSHPCRIRIHATAAGAASDEARPVNTDPPDAAGCIFEYVATTAGSFNLSPLVDGADMDLPADGIVPLTVGNPSESAEDIAVSFTYLNTEP